MNASLLPSSPRRGLMREGGGLGILIGLGVALGLFFVMAIAQLIDSVDPPKSDLDASAIAFVPPEIAEVEPEPPPPTEEEPPPPELEPEPPQISLEQLDIALNPGTGGSLIGNFSMPTIGTSSSDLGTEDFVDFSKLDQIPRPIGVSGFNFPRHLLKQSVRGNVVLLVKLDESGDVLDVQLDRSNLPQFESFVLGEVRGWQFTPPTQQGRPVRAMARLPIPIHIR